LSDIDGNKVRLCISLTVKRIRGIDVFSNTGSSIVSYVLNTFQYGTTSGTTHIKTIFSFSTGTGQNFISLCSSDYSCTQFIHILNFFTINNVFYNPEENVHRSQVRRRREPGNLSPFPVKRSGNSLFRKEWARREILGGAPSSNIVLGHRTL